MHIDGIAAVVTVAASGLADATTRALRARGARVVAIDLDFPQSAQNDRESVHFVTADVSSADEIESAIDVQRASPRRQDCRYHPD
jgi:NAD(P)-dependent dehydrogenase (short-subunit alcohol dehydrogenase family)